jgi:hypothetical protein
MKKGAINISLFRCCYKAANPNQFEKDFIETDKKVNLMESALNKNIKDFPNNDANKWVSSLELGEAGLKGMDSTYTKVFALVFWFFK